MRIRVSNFAFGIFPIIALILYLFVILSADVNIKPGEEWVIPFSIVFSVIYSLLVLYLAWAGGKYYILTDKGIEHKLWGICYRKTAWDEIEDVALCELPVAVSYRFRGLIVTRKGTTVYRPNEYLPKPTKRFYRHFLPDWIRGRLFLLRTNDVKNGDRILPFIVEHYGLLDYDWFKETGQPYSYPKDYPNKE